MDIMQIMKNITNDINNLRQDLSDKQVRQAVKVFENEADSGLVESCRRDMDKAYDKLATAIEDIEDVLTDIYEFYEEGTL